MDFAKAIITFLGLQDVRVLDLKINRNKRIIELKVRQKRESCFCSSCGELFSQVKDWELKTLRAPPLGIFDQVVVKFYQLRGVCGACKKTQVSSVDWIHPRFKSMTCSFAEVAGRLMEEITCEAASRMLHTPAKTLWDLDQHRMEVMLQMMELPPDLDTTYLCADEVHFRTVRQVDRKGLFAKRWKSHFVCNLVCPKEGKVLFNSLGRERASLISAMQVLSPWQKQNVKQFAVDMHEPFISAIKAECPNAEVVIDRFHLAQKINEAFDSLRKHEFKKAKATNDSLSENMLEPHRRFILVQRNKNNLSKSETKLIEKLRFFNSSIHLGMLLVEQFHQALDRKTIKKFREDLITWYKLAREAKLPAFLKFAKTLRRYRKNIEGYITSRLTTAVIEGLNNKIKVLKRMAYGYSNPTSFCRKILQRCGYLNSRSINTDTFFYKWPNPAI